MVKSDFDIALKASLLDQLSDPVKQFVMSHSRLRNFVRGEVICLQDEPAETIKIVVKGCIKLYRVSLSGHEAIVDALPIGESFDEVAAMQGLPCPVTAEAISDCTMMFLDVSAIRACENAEREMNAVVLNKTSTHIDYLVRHIEQLKAMNGMQRLSEFLIEQCDVDAGRQNFELPYEKSVLAGKLGMKPESLSRAFGRLRKLGVRSSMKRVSIDNVATLRAVSDACGTFI